MKNVIDKVFFMIKRVKNQGNSCIVTIPKYFFGRFITVITGCRYISDDRCKLDKNSKYCKGEFDFTQCCMWKKLDDYDHNINKYLLGSYCKFCGFKTKYNIKKTKTCPKCGKNMINGEYVKIK